jgi:hypothetical protein
LPLGRADWEHKQVSVFVIFSTLVIGFASLAVVAANWIRRVWLKSAIMISGASNAQFDDDDTEGDRLFILHRGIIVITTTTTIIIIIIIAWIKIFRRVGM